jgi:hypothetical protein
MKIGTRLVSMSLLLLALVVVGCSGEKPTGSVEGKVTYNGQPLQLGTIIFYWDNGKAQKATAVQAGAYKADKIPAGPTAVAVTAMTVPEIFLKPGQPPPNLQTIPAKYNNRAQSGLAYDVKAGPQTKDFELTD